MSSLQLPKRTVNTLLGLHLNQEGEALLIKVTTDTRITCALGLIAGFSALYFGKSTVLISITCGLVTSMIFFAFRGLAFSQEELKKIKAWKKARKKLFSTKNLAYSRALAAIAAGIDIQSPLYSKRLYNLAFQYSNIRNGLDMHYEGLAPTN